MGYHIFYNLIKEFPTNLRRFIIRRMRRFNAIPRAEKVIEHTRLHKGERAPLPEKIQQKINELLKNNPELLTTVSDKNETLLDRLKSVFVTSTGKNMDMFGKAKLTPMEYNLFRPEANVNFEEHIPEGKFTLKQADQFLKDFQKNPNPEAVDALSYRYKIEPQKMMQMLTHTKIFKVSLPLNTKPKPYVNEAYDHLVPAIIQSEPDEEKMYRILESRTEKFRRFYQEKLGLQDQQFSYVVKNPTIRKLLSVKTSEEQEKLLESGIKDETKFLSPKEKVVSLAQDSKTIVVCDLKPGEDPNEFEKIPEFKGIEAYGRIRSGDADIERVSPIIIKPDTPEFDVFKVMEQQDRKIRKEKRLKEKEKQKLQEEKELQQDLQKGQ